MTELKSVACPICGCLCDDLEVTVENNEIVKEKNGCALCEAKMVHGYKKQRKNPQSADTQKRSISCGLFG